MAITHQVPHQFAFDGIQFVGRLVENKDALVAHQCGGDSRQPALSAGQAIEAAVGVGREAHPFEPADGLALRPFRREAAQARCKGNGLHRSQGGHGLGFLGVVRDPTRDLFAASRDVDAVHPDLASGGTELGDHLFDQGRLARAVRAEQAQNLAGLQRQGDAVVRRFLALLVHFHDVLHIVDRFHGRTPLPRGRWHCFSRLYQGRAGRRIGPETGFSTRPQAQAGYDTMQP